MLCRVLKTHQTLRRTLQLPSSGLMSVGFECPYIKRFYHLLSYKHGLEIHFYVTISWWTFRKLGLVLSSGDWFLSHAHSQWQKYCDVGYRHFVAFTRFNATYSYTRPGWLSRYSDWLRARRPRGRSSSTGRGNIFVVSTSPISILGPFSLLSNGYRGVKRPVCEADHSLPTVPRSRICRFIHILPHTYSRRSA
jgi:hypothetical protein